MMVFDGLVHIQWILMGLMSNPVVVYSSLGRVLRRCTVNVVRVQLKIYHLYLKKLFLGFHPFLGIFTFPWPLCLA